MTVMLKLSCNGCDATAESTDRLRMRFHGTHGDHGWGTARVDDPRGLAPAGWVMFDPYTYMTYCPRCWAEIASPEPEEGA